MHRFGPANKRTPSRAVATSSPCVRVALAGNPNTGKTTLFNRLTGYRQHVGNYPGVTVERKTGFLRHTDSERRIELIDLPGAYSLAAGSAEEGIALDVLLGYQEDAAGPEVVVVVLDATNLARNLFLASQLLELGRPVIAALNMVDLAEASGTTIDSDALSRELGIPILPVVATSGRGIVELTEAIVQAVGQPAPTCRPSFPACIQNEVDQLAEWLTTQGDSSTTSPDRVELLQILLVPGGHHETRLAQRLGDSLREELATCRRRIHDAGESLAEVEARIRYDWINRICSRTVTQAGVLRSPKSEAVDRWLTHRVFGLVILLAVMAICFQAMYSWSAPLMDAIDGTFAAFGAALATAIPKGALQSLLVDGGVAGVGAVLVFLPQILVLFLFIAVLEDVGYMARAALLLDRWMGLLGLNGRSFIPLLSSFACAVPGIMATRVIEDRRDRLVTMLIAPLMSCSARLPVYVLLISAFIPATPLLGGLIGLQSAVLLAMYLVGVVVAVCVAVVLKKTVLPGKPQPFLIELPTYKWPSPGTVFHRAFQQGKEFCISAGTIIFAVSIVVWALGYYPRPKRIAMNYRTQRGAAQLVHAHRVERIAESFDDSAGVAAFKSNPAIAGVRDRIAAVERKFAAVVVDRALVKGSPDWNAARQESDDAIAALASSEGNVGAAALALYQSERELTEAIAAIDRNEAGAYLRQSLLGRGGKWIEPFVRPLGWDWRIGTAVIASFPAREVVLATMGTIFNLGENQDETSMGLRSKLHHITRPDGRPVMNTAVALSLMVFFALCCQCGATLATIKRETNSWRWPLLTFGYMTSLAYIGALATYRIAIWFA